MTARQQIAVPGFVRVLVNLADHALGPVVDQLPRVANYDVEQLPLGVVHCLDVLEVQVHQYTVKQVNL